MSPSDKDTNEASQKKKYELVHTAI